MLDIVIKVDLYKCELINLDSNYKYYRLPFSVILAGMECDILCEEYKEGKLEKYYLGNYLEGYFDRVLMLDVTKEGELDLTNFLNVT